MSDDISQWYEWVWMNEWMSVYKSIQPLKYIWHNVCYFCSLNLTCLCCRIKALLKTYRHNSRADIECSISWGFLFCPSLPYTHRHNLLQMTKFECKWMVSITGTAGCEISVAWSVCAVVTTVNILLRSESSNDETSSSSSSSTTTMLR